MDLEPVFDLSDEWPSNPDDLLDSLFLNDGFLSDFDGNINFNDLPSTVVKDRISPDLSTEPEFHGFVNDMNHKPVNDVSEYINYSANNQSTSSNGSDSGLSSDNMDNMEVDISPDYEPLSPTLSSPGPSISERGGQNSPPRTAFMQPMRQPMKPKSTIIASSSKVVGKHQPMPSNIRTAVQQKKEVKIYKMTPATQVVTAGSTNKKVTIQMKDSPIAVKPQSTGKFVINKQNPNVQGVRKLIRVQNPSNPRSILLPVSFQDVKDFRTIKIINASSLNNKSSNIKMAAANLLQQSKKGLVPKNVLVSKEQLIDDSMSDHTSDAESYVFDDVMMTSNSLATPSETGNNSDSSDSNHDTQSSYPKLTLTNEEKRLLAKEGISLPGNYPLTKHEERELKRIRRKIRNKISAQDSRKRKKEYVDGLEERVKQCTDENQTLIKRIKQLQSQNHNLMSQMKKLQTLLTKGTSKTAQPATCLMVLLLSLALVAVPNLKLGQNPKETELTDVLEESLLQNRRSLLFDTKQQFGDALVDEEMNLDDILAFNDQVSEHNYAADVESIVSGVSMAKKPRTFIEFDVDDKIWKPPTGAASDFDGKANEFHDQMKSSHSSGFNIDRPLNDDVLSTQPKELYEMKLDTISSFAKGGAEVEIMHDKVMIGGNDEERKKLNASQISGSERKILMKGA
ncbi:CRE-binding bZIP protein SKO1-like isoform X2 [Bradysia coprophila]|uniref:CRE-binding bZIP protein SKO1-like isoform X2 n=1 Tax=Bradysia coprophila TaxID=38358 RepID=UPI00187D70A1|nr:CRE-binding bZIP protein SKO1-like isoform X2 [Bradysia coprophila]